MPCRSSSTAVRSGMLRPRWPGPGREPPQQGVHQLDVGRTRTRMRSASSPPVPEWAGGPRWSARAGGRGTVRPSAAAQQQQHRAGQDGPAPVRPASIQGALGASSSTEVASSGLWCCSVDGFASPLRPAPVCGSLVLAGSWRARVGRGWWLGVLWVWPVEPLWPGTGSISGGFGSAGLGRGGGVGDGQGPAHVDHVGVAQVGASGLGGGPGSLEDLRVSGRVARARPGRSRRGCRRAWTVYGVLTALVRMVRDRQGQDPPGFEEAGPLSQDVGV